MIKRLFNCSCLNEVGVICDIYSSLKNMQKQDTRVDTMHGVIVELDEDIKETKD